MTLSWDYGEAHHFKGPHDGIGGSVKWKLYQDVLSNQIITSSKHFAQYANEVCNSVILYLDKTDITEVDVTNAVYMPGTLQVQSVQRIGLSKLDFYTTFHIRR